MKNTILAMAVHGLTPAPLNGYHIKAKGNDKAEILIYEDIGEGWLGGIGAKKFAEDLRDMGTLKEINVRINSAGGSVFDGIAIYNTLRRNGARIVVDVDGLAASIASIIAMAGDEINMAENATMMIHNPWGVFAGDAESLREQADLLDKVRGQLVTTYANQAIIDQASIESLMDAETWMDAGEALEHGFITAITSEMKLAAHPDVSKFKHAPESLLKVKSMVQKRSKSKSPSDASVQMSKMAAKVAGINS